MRNRQTQGRFGRVVGYAAGCLLAAAIAAQPAAAIELGDIELQSGYGEPLEALIPIAALVRGERDDLQVAVASAAVYRNIDRERSAYLDGIRIDLVERDGQPVLRLRSEQSLRQPFLTVLLEAQWRGNRLLREYILTPDISTATAPAAMAARASAPGARPSAAATPMPPPAWVESSHAAARSVAVASAAPVAPVAAAVAPAPAPAPVPVSRVTHPDMPEFFTTEAERRQPPVTRRPPATPAARPPQRNVAPAAPAADRALDPELLAELARDTRQPYRPTGRVVAGQYTVVRGETLWRVALNSRPDAGVSMDQMQLAIARANPDAFLDGDLRRLRSNSRLRIPDRAGLTAVDARTAQTQLRQLLASGVAAGGMGSGVSTGTSTGASTRTNTRTTASTSTGSGTRSDWDTRTSATRTRSAPPASTATPSPDRYSSSTSRDRTAAASGSSTPAAGRATEPATRGSSASASVSRTETGATTRPSTSTTTAGSTTGSPPPAAARLSPGQRPQLDPVVAERRRQRQADDDWNVNRSSFRDIDAETAQSAGDDAPRAEPRGAYATSPLGWVWWRVIAVGLVVLILLWMLIRRLRRRSPAPGSASPPPPPPADTPPPTEPTGPTEPATEAPLIRPEPEPEMIERAEPAPALPVAAAPLSTAVAAAAADVDADGEDAAEAEAEAEADADVAAAAAAAAAADGEGDDTAAAEPVPVPVAPPPSEPETAAAADEPEALVVDLADFDGEPETPAVTAPDTAAAEEALVLPEAFGLDDFDADDEVTTVADGDEVATRLDLAHAYIGMGDHDMARALLREVLDQGDEAQRGEARTLLDGLG